MIGQKFLRRKSAADYLRDKYGWGSWQTLAKLAVMGGGPVYRKFGRAVVYAPDDLDEWALARLGDPQRSTAYHATTTPVPHLNHTATHKQAF